MTCNADCNGVYQTRRPRRNTRSAALRHAGASAPLLSEQIEASATILMMMADEECPIDRGFLRSLARDMAEWTTAVRRGEVQRAMLGRAA